MAKTARKAVVVDAGRQEGGKQLRLLIGALAVLIGSLLIHNSWPAAKTATVICPDGYVKNTPKRSQFPRAVAPRNSQMMASASVGGQVLAECSTGWVKLTVATKVIQR
eukprot:TRINITY_DN23937_c0_g1_i3.p1 TRINITY_DN23937_c0_g1~~TRINITY_DN23937_c0_g1_i3.p1  ORF type:complete len:108 (-),score=8.17 TRINITY_DN23937_c0_g1_i3:198-521(-)